MDESMNRETYKDLILRFAKELHEVGVTEDMKKRAESSYDRHPNISSVSVNEDVRKFSYHFEGFLIEAKQTIELKVAKKSS